MAHILTSRPAALVSLPSIRPPYLRIITRLAVENSEVLIAHRGIKPMNSKVSTIYCRTLVRVLLVLVFISSAHEQWLGVLYNV
jgi:hypothetical protein